MQKGKISFNSIFITEDSLVKDARLDASVLQNLHFLTSHRLLRLLQFNI